MIKKADTQLIKLINERKLLNIIRQEGPLSRIELAKKTYMSKVAVFEIISRLTKEGFVQDIGKGESTNRGGKKPTLVKLNPGSHFVIGIEFKREEVRLAIADIEAFILDKKKIKYPVGTPAWEVLTKVFTKLDQLLEKHAVSKDKLTSIGIGIPGLVDYQNGRLRFADTLKDWDTVPIAQVFTDKYNVPVILENDVNTIALGESILGAGKEQDNIICMWMGEGIGAGIILEKHLIQGIGGSTGEIGYLELSDDRVNDFQFKYLLNNRRYFGDILSSGHLYNTLCTQLEKCSKETEKKPTLKQLLKKEIAANPELLPILDEYAYILSILCTNLIKIINPNLIILSGKVIENSKYIFEKLNSFIDEKLEEIPFVKSQIVLGQLKEEAGLRGAIAMALQVIFDTKISGSATKWVR